MGFQTGTTIRPELGNADYSGFANAATITANAYAKLGDQIGAGIEKYQKKKKEKDDNVKAFEFLKQTGAFGDISDDALQAGINSVGASTLVDTHVTLQNQRRADERHEGELQSAILRNRQLEQQINQSDLMNPLSLNMTQAQIKGMTDEQQRARELFPFTVQGLTDQSTITKQQIDQNELMNPLAVQGAEQGIASGEANIAMAGRRQDLAEQIANNNKEQNQAKLNLMQQELNLKVATALRGDDVSAKKVADAQAYLDANDIVIADGAFWSKTGWFNGKLTEITNPALARMEGMDFLLSTSVSNTGTNNNSPSNNEGFSIESVSDAGVSPGETTTVSQESLDNIVAPAPEGSRASRALGGAMDFYNKTAQIGEGLRDNSMAAIPASLEYVFSSDNPEFGSTLEGYSNALKGYRRERDKNRRSNLMSRDEMRNIAQSRY